MSELLPRPDTDEVIRLAENAMPQTFGPKGVLGDRHVQVITAVAARYADTLRAYRAGDRHALEKLDLQMSLAEANVGAFGEDINVTGVGLILSCTRNAFDTWLEEQLKESGTAA